MISCLQCTCTTPISHHKIRIFAISPLTLFPSGLDIPEVDLVIQCQPPRDVDSYVHRAGRTGRAGRSGIAICLYHSGDVSVGWDRLGIGVGPCRSRQVQRKKQCALKSCLQEHGSQCLSSSGAAIAAEAGGPPRRHPFQADGPALGPGHCQVHRSRCRRVSYSVGLSVLCFAARLLLHAFCRCAYINDRALNEVPKEVCEMYREAAQVSSIPCPCFFLLKAK
jgi:hypothetical protein